MPSAIALVGGAIGGLVACAFIIAFRVVVDIHREGRDGLRPVPVRDEDR